MFILSIDQGTTGSTVSLFNKQGQVIDKVNKEFEQIFPKPGWVEHNPEHIWNSVISAMKELISKSAVDVKKIQAIGITNQRETIVLWDKTTGKPVYNAIVWQCRRTADFCNKLKKSKQNVNLVKNKTGLVLDPYFSASKINWILKNVKGLKAKIDKGNLLAGTIDSYLLWRLTGRESHKTDVSNASRTQLMNIKTGEWDSDLLKLFKVPESILPKIKPSNSVFGVTNSVPGLPNNIPISGIAGDQQAALFGQSCFKAGDAKCTFGTGSFILMNTGNKLVRSRSGILTTVAWQLKGQKKMTYALEGGAFICGAAVQWLRDGLGLIEKSSDIEKLAKQVESSEGVEIVPAFVGLGAPYWKSDARAIISGLTRGSKRAHIARATLDAMALQNVDILKAMEKDLKITFKNLKVDGGASANNLLMQLQSNYLGKKIIRPQVIETTAAGAAFLAGLGVGFWKDQKEIQAIWAKDKEFKSSLSLKKRQDRIKSWHKAISLV